MRVTLSAADIREARIWTQAFEAGKAVGYRAGCRAALRAAMRGEGERQARRVVAEIAGRRGVAVAELTGRSRTTGLGEARALACFLIQRLAGLDATRAGRIFGGRDRSTVFYAVARFEILAAADPARWNEARSIARALGMALPASAGTAR